MTRAAARPNGFIRRRAAGVPPRMHKSAARGMTQSSDNDDKTASDMI